MFAARSAETSSTPRLFGVYRVSVRLMPLIGGSASKGRGKWRFPMPWVEDGLQSLRDPASTVHAGRYEWGKLLAGAPSHSLRRSLLLWGNDMHANLSRCLLQASPRSSSGVDMLSRGYVQSHNRLSTPKGATISNNNMHDHLSISIADFCYRQRTVRCNSHTSRAISLRLTASMSSQAYHPAKK